MPFGTAFDPIVCCWCGHEYKGKFNAAVEEIHLSSCIPYQTRPADRIYNGKEFLEVPGSPGIFVERVTDKKFAS